MYIQKVEKKGRTKQELDEVICWLTGYSLSELQQQIDDELNIEEFFQQVPLLNPNISLIKGVVCGVRVEEVEEPLMRKVRYLDKLVDELAKGKAMKKILRSNK
jgi:hypothetical protein